MSGVGIARPMIEPAKQVGSLPFVGMCRTGNAVAAKGWLPDTEIVGDA